MCIDRENNRKAMLMYKDALRIFKSHSDLQEQSANMYEKIGKCDKKRK